VLRVSGGGGSARRSCQPGGALNAAAAPPRPNKVSALRRIWLICAIALMSIQAACSSDPDDDARPNILLILVDDLGYNDVSYNGATEISTPNIDRLAQEGVIFSNGYAPHLSCGPSHAGLMTGRYPGRLGFEFNLPYAPFDDNIGLSLSEKTIADRLKEFGYSTGVIGKWHLGAAPAFHPLNRGFDSFFGFVGGEHDYYRVDATASPFHEFLQPFSENRRSGESSGYLTDELTDRAIKFISDERDEPFFLFLSYNAPHSPLQAPDDLIDRYGHVDDPKRRTYLAMVDSLDANLGLLMSALETSGEWENTATFFLSDNGGTAHGWADNAPFSGAKGSLMEGGIRVPFLASWPARWPAGKTFEVPVISLDIAATALALAGAVSDNGLPEVPLDGVDLDPFIRGAVSDPPHDALFWRSWRYIRSNTRYAVRVGDFKLVRADAEGEAALFNLRSDPGETNNMVDEHPDTAAQLAELWNDWNSQNLPALFSWKETYYRARAEAQSELTEWIQEIGKRLPFRIGGPSEAMSPPAAPAGLRAMVEQSGAITLEWNYPGDPTIIGYQFRLRLAGETQWRPWEDFASGWVTTSYEVESITGGVTYDAQIRAGNDGGWSSPSETATGVAGP